VIENRHAYAYGSLGQHRGGAALLTLGSTVMLGWFVARGYAGLSMAAAVALLAAPFLLARPENGLLVGIAVALVVPSTAAFGSGQLRSVSVGVALSLIGFVVLLVRRSDAAPRLTIPDWFFFGLVAAAWVSWWVRPHVAHSAQAALSAVVPAGFYVAGRWFGALRWQKLAATVLAAATAGSVTVLYEFLFTHRPLFTNPNSYFWTASGQAIFRAAGVFESPPAAGLTLAMATLVGSSLLATTLGRRQRQVVWVCVAASFVGLIVTFTRASVIAFAVGLMLYLWLLRPGALGRLIYATILVGSISVLFVLPHVTRTSWYQASITRPGDLTVRESYWTAAWPVIANSPRHLVFGHGINALYRNRAALTELLDPQPDILSVPTLSTVSPHSQYVRTLVEEGLVGLLLFVGWLGIALIRAVRGAFRAAGPHRAALAACAAALVAFLVNSSVDDTLREWPCFALVALVAGAAVTLAQSAVSAGGAQYA
jgi:O-antigen ligase